MAEAQQVPVDISESSSEEELELPGRKYRTRMHPFEQFTNEEFRRRYRVSKAIAQRLVDDFMHFVPLTGGGQGYAVSIEDKVCLALRYFATGSNYSLVADYQGVSISTVSRSVKLLSDHLYENAYKNIHWPESEAEKEAVARDFLYDYGYPRVIGIVDGTHVAIVRPRENEPAFINRKGYYSLNAMFVCDARMRIIHVNSSWPGSVHDSYAFNASEIRAQADNHILDPYFLLGDSGYGCKPNLFTPVDHPLTDAEVDFNCWHRSTRSLIERAIGMVKQRWRCMDGHGGFLFHQPHRAAKIITACCVLHNLCVDAGIPVEEDYDEDGYHPNNAFEQPDDQAGGEDVTGRRTAYIEHHFNNA